MRGFQFKMVIYRLLNSSPPETLTYTTYGIISSEKNPDTSWVTQMTKNPHQKGLGHTLNYQEPLRKESGLDNHKDLRTNQELGMGWMLRVLLCKTTPSGLRDTWPSVCCRAGTCAKSVPSPSVGPSKRRDQAVLCPRFSYGVRSTQDCFSWNESYFLFSPHCTLGSPGTGAPDTTPSLWQNSIGIHPAHLIHLAWPCLSPSLPPSPACILSRALAFCPLIRVCSSTPYPSRMDHRTIRNIKLTKSLLGFCHNSFWKTQTNILANPVALKAALHWDWAVHLAPHFPLTVAPCSGLVIPILQMRKWCQTCYSIEVCAGMTGLMLPGPGRSRRGERVELLLPFPAPPGKLSAS